MGNGLTLDGTGYVSNSDDSDINPHSADWTFEAWIKPSSVDDGGSTSYAIFFVGDGDGDEGDDELQIGMRGGHLELCYDSCTGSGSDKKLFSSVTEWVADKWYHIAVSYDADGNNPQPGYNAFINGERVSGDVDAIGFKTVISSSYPSAGNTEYYLGTGDLSGSSGGVENFEGVIDEARWLTYEKNAFAGGLMISKVVPSTNTVTIYNSGDFTMDLTGVDIWNGASSCGFSGTLTAGDGTLGGTDTDTCTLTVGTTDGIRMLDDDGDNDASSVIGGGGRMRKHL